MNSWSYSSLLTFESCPLKYKFRHIDRLPTKPAPAAERGTQVHLAAEQYINKTVSELAPELLSFKEDLAALRGLGSVNLEEEWGFASDWTPCDYKTAWFRMKADVAVINATTAVIIDFKTGRKDGNEIKHGEQVQLYSLALVHRNPAIERVTAELWYIDKDDLTCVTYKREELMRFVPRWTSRGLKVTTAEDFNATPNAYSCRFCDYKEQCPQAVQAPRGKPRYPRKGTPLF